MLSSRWKLWTAFCAALLVAVPARGIVPALSEIEASVRRLERLVEAARFREAALEAPQLRDLALDLPPGGAARQLLVRTEIAAATAALALRQDGTARVHLHRALQLEPGLALGAGAAPKLRRTLDTLRGSI